MPHLVARTLIGTWVALCAMAAQAQPAEPASGALPAALRNVLDGLFGSKPLPPTSAGPTSTRPNPARPDEALQPNAAALNELKVDKQCLKVEERFDVWAKAAEYAGTNAQLRLQRLVASDFQHDQLTDDDKRLLRYLAYTTIWVPVSVEAGIGKLYATLSGGGGDQVNGRTGRTQQLAMDRMNQRLAEVVGGIPAFPGSASLVLDPDLRDGAFARAGGLVVISPRFLNLMDEKDEVRDVVFAHEASHLYKRHTIKEMQYQLISSAAGFSIAKKLLGKFNPAASPSLLPDFIAHVQTANELFTWMRNTQSRYSKDQELEADACALNWLKPLNVEPRQAWSVFGAILAESSGADSESYQSLHPSPDERVANIRQAIDKPRAPPTKGKPGAKPASPGK